MTRYSVERKQEHVILKEALTSKEAELISVIGRRRVGKTFLVKSFYKDQLVFELTGVQSESTQEQLVNFSQKLAQFSGAYLPVKPPKSWKEAFYLLEIYLKKSKSKNKKVVFFDELPWLASPKSGFLQAFAYFWNSWANWENIVVVICGSAASWMIKKIDNNKGGLHNRITKRIHLKPFTLAETERYLKGRGMSFSRYETLHLYMAMGGVPHYLKEIRRGKSVVQNIDSICFSNNGLLKNEFSNLYSALFDHADNHIAVIRALASKRKGMSRAEIIKKAKLPTGGGLSRVLQELQQSDFISVYHPFGKKERERLFRLTDEYSLFYLQFIENKQNEGAGIWKHLSQTQAYKSWSGYAFESICLKHISQIKKALGIVGIFSLSSTFFKKGTKAEKGAQIDLILDRNDHTINLFEIKFGKDHYRIDKTYADKLREKRSVFEQNTKTKKHLSWVMITTFGLTQNSHSSELIESELTMDVLFEEVE